MNLTRRDFGKLAAASLPALRTATLATFSPSAHAQSGKWINSTFSGVTIGLQPYCYHDLAMIPANRHILKERLVQNQIGVVELHAAWCDPPFSSMPGLTPAEVRQKIHDFRVNTPPSFYEAIRKEFNDAGIRIYSYYAATYGMGSNVGVNLQTPPEEIDALYNAAKALGANALVGSYGIAVSDRVGSQASKHPGMIYGLHGHDNISDPDAFSTEETFAKGLALHPESRIWLDLRHFAAANGDAVDFLEKHHARTATLHVGDRRRNNGRSTPFGEGDAPIVEVLRMLRDNKWAIMALIEFEHGTLRSGVDEVQLMFDYCKRALES
jgi:hypothetical protein